MRRFASILGLALLFAGLPVFAPSAKAVDGRNAEAILKDIDGVQMPDLSKLDRSNKEAVEKFIADRQAALAKKADLIGELFKAAPENGKLKTLLPERWNALLRTDKPDVAAVKEETSAVLKNDKLKAEGLKTEAAFFAAFAVFRGEENNFKAQLEAVESFIKIAPQDDRCPMLLYSAASNSDDSKQKTDLYRRVIKDYPKSRVVSAVEGSLKQFEGLGKPFELAFTDAIKGSEISIKGLKGKVVVIDFWATWCGPCVAEMPKMKKLYSDFHDKGVEFIGVSLDAPKEEGGLDKLKEFVATNEIPWPQYYQGNGWNSEFSKSWYINGIPALFVVDAEGKLFSVEARGKLDKMLPELLEKAKAGTPASGAGGGN